jgi:hypothetical protein
MKHLVLLMLVASALPLSGCAAYQQSLRGPLGERAAFDLECPQPDLVLKELSGPWLMEVTGCGKQAAYVFINGQWLLDTEAQRGVLRTAVDEVRVVRQRASERDGDRARSREQWEKERERERHLGCYSALSSPTDPPSTLGTCP